jgi:hypothetical protein
VQGAKVLDYMRNQLANQTQILSITGADINLGKGKDTEVVLFAATGKPRSTMTAAEQQNALSAPAVEVQTAAMDEKRSGGNIEDLVAALISRGIRDVQARRLIETKTEEQCARVREIISYFDHLCSSPAGKKMKSPVGFLYRAVEKPEAFVMPGEDARRPEQENLKFGASAQTAQKKSAVHRHAALESLYLVERKRQVQKLKEDVEPSMLKKLAQEVETGLIKLKTLLSPERFAEAVNHGVEERILKLFVFPTFEEWVKRR